MQEAELFLYQPRYSKRKPSTLQKNWDAMISAHQMVGWTDGRKEKTFLLRQFHVCLHMFFQFLR